MLKIKTFVVNPICENCYVVNDESGEAVIIDCGAGSVHDNESLRSYIESERLRLVHHLCTHAHFDHIMGSPFLYETYGLIPEIHVAEQTVYDQMPQMMQAFLGRPFTAALPVVRHHLNDGDIVAFGSHHFQVIATPGHTPGGVCFYCEAERVLFCGDTLFCMSIGRTDLPGGNYGQLIHSVTGRLMTLPDEVKAYPGHGEFTTIGAERTNNPYLIK